MATVTTPRQTPQVPEDRGTKSPVVWVVLATLGVVLVIGGLLWLAFGGNGVSIEDETAALEQLMIEQEQAQNARDADAMVAMLAPDAVVHMNDLPPIVGREAFKEAYAQVWPIFVSADLNVTETVVSESGDIAWMHGTQVMELDLPDVGRVSAPGKWMTALEKIDGEWLVIGLNISEVAPPTG